MMSKLSLFSGIGGDDLASEWAGIKTVCFVEIDKYCQRVLRKHWPDTPIIEKVQDVTKEKIIYYAFRGGFTGNARRRSGSKSADGYVRDIARREGTIDIISGGFPCQPHSVAGKHKGSTDERNLWPEFRRIIGEIKPRWVVAENVPGLFSSDAGRFFGEVLADLAALGYSVGWCTFGAVDVGAWHRRDRVFIIAYSTDDRQPRSPIYLRQRRPEEKETDAGGCGADVPDSQKQQDNRRGRGDLDAEAKGRQGINTAFITSSQDVADTTESRLERTKPERTTLSAGCFAELFGNNWWAVEPDVGRVAHGIPSRVDRLKGLGNAVVPQQIYPIYKAIMEESRN